MGAGYFELGPPSQLTAGAKSFVKLDGDDGIDCGNQWTQLPRRSLIDRQKRRAQRGTS